MNPDSDSSYGSRSNDSGEEACRADDDFAAEVSVQLSRFHLETIDNSSSNEVDVRGLCLSVGDKELLRDAHLSLRPGVRYGLIGRNGVGKSTLLKALANKTIPGLPRDMKILYVQQDNVPGDTRSVLHTVLTAASRRGALRAHIAELEAALEAAEAEAAEGEAAIREAGGDAGDGSEVPGQQQQQARAHGGPGSSSSGGGGGAGGAARLVAVVGALVGARVEQRAVEADQTAARRSRTRGKQALKAAVAAREEARKAQQQQLSPSEAASLAPQLLADLYQQLEDLPGPGPGGSGFGAGAGCSEEAAEAAEARAAAGVLAGLGFGAAAQQRPTGKLSGGWRMRVALACALLARPRLLLLDEPTNHLDLGALLWLQDYLAHRCPGVTLLLVSHDRAFLNAVAQETVLMREGRLEYFPGSYEAYMQARSETGLRKERQVASQERQRAHLQDTIARAERAARQAGDDKRLLQAASRRKKVERLGAEKTEDGRRFKVSYWAGYHETLRPQIELERPEEPVVLQLPPPEPLRHRGPLLQLRDVTVAYPAAGRPMGPQGPTGHHAAAASSSNSPNTPSNRPAGQYPAGGTHTALTTNNSSSSKRPVGHVSKTSNSAQSSSSVSSGPNSPSSISSSCSNVVLRNVTLDIEQNSRIGLLGLNGSGKSSLLRLLAGRLAPAAGEVASPAGAGGRLGVARLGQHSARRLVGRGAGGGSRSSSRQGENEKEEVEEEEEGDGKQKGKQRGRRRKSEGGGGGGKEQQQQQRTAFSAVQSRAPHLRAQEVYDYLGKLAVPGPLAATPLRALSGGQRCRVALALQVLARPQLLLLDEPTNHLDLYTVHALAEAIQAWEGAVVVASHDLHFLRETCREVWVVEGGALRRQPQPEVGDAIDAYVGALMKRIQRGGAAAAGAAAAVAVAEDAPEAAARAAKAASAWSKQAVGKQASLALKSVKKH